MYYLLRNINPYYTQLVCSVSFGPVTTYWLSVVADFSSISKIWDVTILDSRPGLCVCARTHSGLLPETGSHFAGKHIVFLLHRASFTAAWLRGSHSSALRDCFFPFTKSTLTIQPSAQTPPFTTESSEELLHNPDARVMVVWVIVILNVESHYQIRI